MGSYGNPDVQTPQIDRLAADGVSFDRYYTTTAICMASRATAMTGKYEYKTGCNFEHGDLLTSLWQQSYPVLLREAGYTTAFAGKFGFELRDGPEGEKLGMPEEDFDRWGGGPDQTYYQTAKNESMAAYADDYPHSTRSFIKGAAAGDAPFCLSISFKAPHRPTTPDPIDDDVYAGKIFEKPENYGREKGDHFSMQSRQGRQYKRFHDWHYSDDYDRVMATYYQQIYAIDVAVGMIRDALVEAGVDKNTVVIFTSDNGFFNGSHGYGSKVLPYEEASRVPMIIYDPRSAMGVVTKDKKYLYWGYADEGFQETEELYNLVEDPLELTDLTAQADSQADLKTMRRIYDQHLARWQEQAVAHHGYQPYGTYFDRKASWSEKRAEFAKLGWKPSANH